MNPPSDLLGLATNKWVRVKNVRRIWYDFIILRLRLLGIIKWLFVGIFRTILVVQILQRLF